MAQNSNGNVSDLVVSIRESYFSKFKYGLLGFAAVCYILGNLFFENMSDYSSWTEFFKRTYVYDMLGVMLLVVIIKHIFWFFKISRSKTAEKLLTNYRAHLKWDRIIAGSFTLIIVLVAYYSDGDFAIYASSFLAVTFLCLYFFYTIFKKDETIERLRYYVELGEG